MHYFLLLQPAGIIAAAERHLLITAIALMLTVAIPVYIFLFTFARKYRADNVDAAYDPEFDHNRTTTVLLWGIPATVLVILGIICWQSTHLLDPYRPINSTVEPITIQVIALQWKWLFIYPKQDIATVNFLEFPAGTPLHFVLTADAPMSSFWIPQLGSQIYAMPAMTTQLNLLADREGVFAGADTEINGEGFSGMKFTAYSVSQSDFDTWVASVKQASTTFTGEDYDRLAAPSADTPTSSYASVVDGLYDGVVMKFMMPSSGDASTSASMPMSGAMPGMSM
jgi:cytochrome o ubiquinol oxidase subunit 2